MSVHYNGVILAAGILAAYCIYLKISTYVAISKFKKDHGCREAPRIAQSERIIGLGLLMEMRRRRKSDSIVGFFNDKFKNLNCTTLTASVMGRTITLTCDPRNIKAVLATQFEDFGLGHRLKVFGPLLGEGIFTTGSYSPNGAAWQHSRALVRPAFTRSQVADLEMFDKHTEKLMEQIPINGSTVDLAPLFFRLTLGESMKLGKAHVFRSHVALPEDVAIEFLFGDSTDASQNAKSVDRKDFGAAFDYAQSKLGSIGTYGWTKYVLYRRRFWKSCSLVHAFADEFLAKIQRQKFDRKVFPDEDERYVFLKELAKATNDPKRVRDESMNILLAGRDTTASLLTMSFHLLAKRPDIWAKLKQEVNELGGEKPDYDTLKNMKYLRYFLTESLRLYPVVPGNSRTAAKDTTLPVGGGPDGESPVLIQKGQIVQYSVYSMHRSEKFFGADVLEFKPERWESLRSGWHYLPFNGGPRICVGQQFALAEASYVMVRILQRFETLESRDPLQWAPLLGLTMTSRNGAKVALKV